MYKEMYENNIEESLYHKLISSNVYVKKLEKIVDVPQLLCIVVSAAQNDEFERFRGLCDDCYHAVIRTCRNSQHKNPPNRSINTSLAWRPCVGIR